MSILEKIKSPSDIKGLSEKELIELCGEIREFLIDNISKTGGHLASNLGVVELTVAILKVFDVPEDEIIWDVGHQSYVYKILTGRKDRFSTLRSKGGLSGFPTPIESSYDAFIGGHSSTSVSAALGIQTAKNLSGDKHKAIAVIGDGALSGGLAYEGLNNSGRSKSRMVVILNDNEMSISENVGAMARYLSDLRNKPAYFSLKDKVFNFLKGSKLGRRLIRSIIRSKKALKELIYSNTVFEDMGFNYLGPVNGHDLNMLIRVLERAKTLNVPAFVHVKTVKGKGYEPAEKNPSGYHGVSKFDVSCGCKNEGKLDFSYVFGKTLCELAKKDESICAVSAAMADGTGLSEFAENFPKRFFDVGIAEQHAITFAAGLSSKNKKPVAALYSSFLQRAYDQLFHDVCLENQHVVIGVDRCGITGEDGKTHQGIYDSAFLNTLPNINVLAPASFKELEIMLKTALYDIHAPVAIRYPKGKEWGQTDLKEFCPYSYEKNCADILLVTYGRIYFNVKEAQRKLSEKGIKCDILKLNRIKPLELPEKLEYKEIFFFEEGVKGGGTAQSFASLFPCHIKCAKDIISHGKAEELLEECGLDGNCVFEYVWSVINERENKA